MDIEAKERHKRVTAVVFGVILIGLGVLFLLQNLGLFDAGEIGSWWPLLLIGFGVSSLIAPKDAGASAGGAILAGIGTYFLLVKFDVIEWRLRDVWPVLLLLCGIALIGRAISERRGLRGSSRRSWENGGAR
jgi:Domain of unknown function (DUF5668)